MKKIFFVQVLMILLISTALGQERNGPELNFIYGSRSATIQTEALSAGNFTAEQMAKAILPPGTSVSNVSFNTDEGIGGFWGGIPANFGLNNGIILGSGCVVEASGNSCLWTSLPGDANLNALGSGYSTADASVLEFDFVPQQNQIIFNFIFGSNDYIPYDDICAIFLDGVNIALLPSGSEVSVRTLEFTPNFIHNDGSVMVGVDDYTPTFQAIANVTPSTTHHLKIAVADDGDSAVSSFLFIKGAQLPRIPLSPVALILGAGLIILFTVIRFRRHS